MSHLNELNEADKNCQNNILEATKCGHLDRIKLLHRSGAKLDESNEVGWNALHLAALNHHYSIAKYLLKQGLEVDSLTDSRVTALHIACAEGHYQLVHLLLAHGANPNAQSDTGFTPLICASYNSHLGIIRRLLKEPVKVNQRDRMGANALMIAAAYSSSGCVKLLIEAGSNFKFAPIFGDNPLLSAITHANFSTLKVLLSVKPDQINKLDRLHQESLLFRAVSMLDEDYRSLHLSSNRFRGLSEAEKLKKLQKIQMQIVKYLVKNGAKIDFKHPLFEISILEKAQQSQHQALIDFLNKVANSARGGCAEPLGQSHKVNRHCYNEVSL